MKEYLVLEYSGRAELDIGLAFIAVAGVHTQTRLLSPAREAGGSSHRQGQTEDVVIAPLSCPGFHQDMKVCAGVGTASKMKSGQC